MAVRYERKDGKLKDIVFSCDAPGCDAKPTDKEIIAGGGLIKMGWTKRFDPKLRTYEHFCPKHKQEI